MSNKIILFILIFYAPTSLFSQSREDIIKNIKELLIENYIFLDKAEEVNAHLDELVRKKYFDNYNTPKEFARTLSEEMQKITKDRHLNVAPPRPLNVHAKPDTVSFEWHLQNLVRFREGGFGEVNFFEGNVAYFQLKGFRVEDTIKVDPLMKYLSTADAIIIDLRDNGGGNGPVGVMLSSYFLPTNIPLTGIYERRRNFTKVLSTVPVKGWQKLNVPLFILTSKNTFSAAEAFAYDLQVRDRVTIIGERTGGGAHPVDFMRLPQGYRLIVPVARSINPLTKDNWEGIGVIPDIEIPNEKALDVTKKIAIKSAKNYRESDFLVLEKILKMEKLSRVEEDSVCDLLLLLLGRGHLEDFMINRLGYEYWDAGFKQGALAILRASSIIFPNSPNSNDSYAEILAQNKQYQLALKYSEKAVLLATNQKDKNINMYVRNLNELKSKM